MHSRNPDRHDGLSEEMISLVGLWRIILGGWRFVVAAIGLGLAVAVGFLLLTPAQYEAVGLVDVADDIASITPQKVVERVGLPPFKQAVLRRLAWDNTEARAKVFLASPRASIKRGTDLVEIRVRGLTSADAVAGLTASVDLLAEDQRDLISPMLQSLELNLKAIQHERDEIRHLVKEYDRLASLQPRVEPRNRFSQSLLYLQLVTTKTDRLADLARSENELAERISSISQNSTRLMDEPTVSEQPVYPRSRSIVASAMLAGGFFGLLGVLLAPRARRGGLNQ